ncbi:MAG: hypothetical protein NTX22_08450 [Ignavibacteriales bacterium]|nr:hypothetical protein [Ignavibacteriales bacterium]
MKPEIKFLNQPLEFWANIKLIGQKIGYTEKGTTKVKIPKFENIQIIYKSLGLDSSKIFNNEILTPFGDLLIEYFQHRAKILNDIVEPNLMDKNEAKMLFNKLKKELKPQCPIPMNKQSGKKRTPAFFTGIINMLIEANSKGYHCNYAPMELTAFTQNNFPIRILSRRIDGCFPDVINPIALWEIKEYYYTTTFGSRIADGIYETLLDGYELTETRDFLNKNINHYLMVDAYDTWWKQGKSYLCRICDMLHMGFLTEALFGKEVVDRIPQLVKEWVKELDKKN